MGNADTTCNSFDSKPACPNGGLFLCILILVMIHRPKRLILGVTICSLAFKLVTALFPVSKCFRCYHLAWNWCCQQWPVGGLRVWCHWTVELLEVHAQWVPELSDHIGSKIIQNLRHRWAFPMVKTWAPSATRQIGPLGPWSPPLAIEGGRTWQAPQVSVALRDFGFVLNFLVSNHWNHHLAKPSCPPTRQNSLWASKHHGLFSLSLGLKTGSGAVIKIWNPNLQVLLPNTWPNPDMVISTSSN